jgi:hypothetical protein
MPSTVEAVAVFAFVLLPGALLVWALERVVGRPVIGLPERVTRLLAVSAIVQAVGAPATYWIWHHYFRAGARDAGEVLPLWLWGALLAYVLAPVIAGTLLGRAHRAKRRWTGMFVARTPAPTAWDAVFSEDPAGYVLMRLKSGRWIGGAYEDGSHTGSSSDVADIFLVTRFEVDQEAEDFVRDADGYLIERDGGVLVRWSEIEYLEVSPTKPAGNDS